MVERGEITPNHEPPKQAERLVIHDDVSFRPFSGDIRLPTPEELELAFIHSPLFADWDEYDWDEGGNHFPAESDKSLAVRSEIEFTGARGTIEAVPNFKVAFSRMNIAIVTPLGKVETRRVTRNGKLVLETAPLTLSITFPNTSQEQREMLLRRRWEIGSESGINARFGFHSAYEENLTLNPVISDRGQIVVLPFDVTKLSELEITPHPDNAYDTWLEEEERRKIVAAESLKRREEERERIIFERMPAVMKALLQDEAGNTRRLEDYVSAHALTQVPFSDYLKSFALSEQMISIHAHTVRKGIHSMIGTGVNTPEYLITDGTISVIPDTRSAYQRHIIDQASYIGWMSSGMPGREYRYFLETGLKAGELRKIVNALGIKKIFFECEAIRNW